MAQCLHFLNCRLESLSANCSDTANIFAIRGFVVSTGQKIYLTDLVSHFFHTRFPRTTRSEGFQLYFIEQFPQKKGCWYLQI